MPRVPAVRPYRQETLPTAYCLLPTAYCLLPTAYCLLPTAYCLLPTAYCLLPTAYSPSARSTFAWKSATACSLISEPSASMTKCPPS